MNDALLAFCLELIDLWFHFGKRFILNLIASEVGDHEHLSGQIEILLLTDDIPCLLNVNGHAIHRDLVIGSVPTIDKEFVFTGRVEASPNLLTFL